MSYPVFQVPAGDVLPVMFNAYAGSTGASVTLTGLAVTDIEIYKDGSVTQRASDAGYTLLDTDGIDFDGITGIHGFSIDTGDNTDAGFYTVGAWFTVVVSAVTVDSQTVNFIACQFRLMAAESIAAKPKVDVDVWLGTAAATPTVAGVPEVDLTHVAGATTNVSALATNVDAILTDTADMQPKLGTPAGASISADLLVIDNFVDGIEDTLAAGVTVATNNDKTGYSLAATTGLGNQTANITGNLSGSVGSVTAGVSVANGGIATTSFAAGAIDAAAIAADAITSSELAQSAAQEIADEVLNRDLVGGASVSSRNVRNALRSLRNRAAISAGTLTVYQEDDTTSAWTATVSTTAGDPVSQIDPA